MKSGVATLLTECGIHIDSETGECHVIFVSVADFVRYVLFVPAEQYDW